MSFISSLTKYENYEHFTPKSESTTPSKPSKVEDGEDIGANISSTIKGSGTTEIINERGQLGKNDFMKLLLAQIKYQDPLNPMDNTESIAQMAQFSSLEQMEQLNKSFESIISMQKIANINTSAQYIGKNALIYGENGIFAGEIKTTYIEDGDVKLRIVNENKEEYIASLNDIALLENKGEENSKINDIMKYQNSYNNFETDNNIEDKVVDNSNNDVVVDDLYDDNDYL